MIPVPDVVVEEKADVTHIRPFNKEHAMAGAPFCCANGRKITRTVLWDNPGRSPILACVGYFNEPFFWRDTGSRLGYCTDPLDLVMLPLGFIDGKPVFWSDEIEHKDGTLVAGHVGEFHGMENYRWPSKKSKFFAEWPHPKSDITAKCVEKETFEASGVGLVVTAGDSMMTDAMCQIIGSVAIRRAIEKGQVVLPPDDVVDAEFNPNDNDPAEAAFWSFDARKKGYAEWKGRPQSERDAFKAECRIGIASAVRKAIESGIVKPGVRDCAIDIGKIGTAYGSKEVIDYLRVWLLSPAKDLAQHDMEIAEAVRIAAFRAGVTTLNYSNETMEVRTVRSAILSLDLKQIIAAVKP